MKGLHGDLGERVRLACKLAIYKMVGFENRGIVAKIEIEWLLKSTLLAADSNEGSFGTACK